MKKLASTLALLVTILVLLGIMLGLQAFDYDSPQSVFNPKSLAATGFIILAAFTMGEFFKAIKIPALLGYIAAGILFGPNLAPIISPDLPALFSKQVIHDLTLINVLTVGVIGTMGGGELRIQDIRGNLKTILLVITLLFVLVIPSTTGAVILIAEYAPNLIPFLIGEPKESVIAAALLLGVFALAMSPAATLAILQETKAKGKFTSLVLGIVVVADITLVFSFLLTFSFDKILLAPGGFQIDALVAALPGIAMEFGYALLIGIVTGIIYILYMRFVARELMFFTVAVIFGASYAAEVLHAETLMAFLTAGFVVQNFSKHGHEMVHSLEKISLPVFVIYFMTQAAQLDLQAVFGFIGITIVLTVIRAAAFYAGTSLATRWANAPTTVKQYLWVCFFSRGGVDLVLAAMVGASLSPWGPDFQTIIMAVVVVHIVVGPPLLKFGLDWAGETESARQSVASGENSLVDLKKPDAGSKTEFPIPQLGDIVIQSRMLDLRDFLIELHATHIAEKFEHKATSLRKLIHRLEISTNHSFTSLQDLLKKCPPEPSSQQLFSLASEVQNVQTRFHQSISGFIKDLSSTHTLVIDELAVSDILDQIRHQESFNSSYRITNSDSFFLSSQDDSLQIKALKVLRRFARFVTGSPGFRRIPFGRLWRFYVELGVPRALATAASESSIRNQRLWFLIGQHVRPIDATFSSIHNTICDAAIAQQNIENSPPQESQDSSAKPSTSDAPAPTAPSSLGSPSTVPSSEEDASAPASLPGFQPHQAILDAEQRLANDIDAIQQARDALLVALSDWETTSINFYTLSLQKPFSDLLNATYRAGTLQLPSFFYRPSLRFDASRNAEKALHETIIDEEHYTEGQKGWTVIEKQTLNFGFWFELFNQRLSDKLNTSLNEAVQSKLVELKRFCQALPPSIRSYNHELEALNTASSASSASSISSATDTEDPSAPPLPSDPQAPPEPPVVDWEHWFLSTVKPHLDRVRYTLEFLSHTFNDASPMSQQGRILEVRIERLSHSALLLTDDPNIPEGPCSVINFSLDEWFTQELETAIKLRFSEVNERVRSILQLSLNSINDLEQHISLNLTNSSVTDLADPNSDSQSRINQHAIEVLAFGESLSQELSKSQAKRVAELRRWLSKQLSDLYQASAKPLIERDMRRLRSTHGRATRRARFSLSLPSLFSSFLGHSAIKPFAVSWVDRARSNLFHMIRETNTDPSLNEVRHRLLPASQSVIPRANPVPDIYRRLFTPGPLNINAFYIQRHLSHSDLLSAIQAWFYSPLKSTILLHSDRGFGKASLIRHILDVPALEKIPKVRVRLREDLHSLSDLAQDILEAMISDPSTNMTFDTIQPTSLESSPDSEIASQIGAFHSEDAASRAIKRVADTPMIVVIENAHKVFSRSEDGLELCLKFLSIMNETKGHILWISLFNSSAVQWLDNSIEFKSYFTHSIALEPFLDIEIRRLIERRHPISGFSHTFKPNQKGLFDWLIHPFQTFREIQHPEHQYFRELAKRSHGSPLNALTYWLQCVELNPHDDTNIIVRPLRRSEFDLLAPLSLDKQIILASLIQHGSMTLSCMATVLNLPERVLITEIQHLNTLGFIEVVAGHQLDCYRLNAHAEALITPSLRKRNIL